MRVKKFEGATMRDAIAKVKAELGDQAVIISTRQVRRGLLGSAIEIAAAIDSDEPELPTMSGPTTGGPTSGGSLASTRSGPTTGGPLLPPPRQIEPEVEKLIAPLRSEMRSLRALVRTSNEGRGTSELRAELSALRQQIDHLRQAPPPPAPAPVAREAAPQRDKLHARTASPAYQVPLTAASTGAAVMLVGPTGAGKTTTIAKLAARAALIEHRRIGVVTLDNYRVGGVDQIRTFAELIGVPLEVAETPADLAELIDPANELTLIDTAGRSPRDTAAIAELASQVAGLSLEVHVVIPAGSTGPQIDELIGRYRALAPSRLLFTKLDECDRIPELAHAPTRTGLPITWVTTGQAVPEDIEEPTPARLLELASGGLSQPSSPRTHRAA
jgi:flagellar biosynthesis protein FlhF